MGVAWLIILGFAISSSVDNLGVGISYGIRNIRVGLFANLVIAGICFVFSAAGILFGKWVSKILPGVFPVLVAAFLLFVIGIRIIFLAIPSQRQAAQKKTDGRNSIEQILANPEIADADNSGEIGLGEAVVLGIALSANALTNGLSAGLLGLSPLAISSMAAVGSYLSVWAGVSLGHRVACVRIGCFSLGEFGTLFSGVIILGLAAHTLL